MIEQPPAVKYTSSVLNMIQKPEIKKLVSEINGKYLYWDRVKYAELPKGVDHAELWSCVKLYRNLNRSNFFFSGTFFSFHITDNMQQLLHEFDMNIGGYMGSDGIIPEGDKQRYLVNSIMEEAIASSQMEGAATTRRKAKDMLRKEAKPQNRSEQMILNNYQTICHIVDHKDEDLTPRKLLEIHRLMTSNTLENSDEAGRFRDSDDIYVVDHTTSEPVHTPPPCSQINAWVSDLCDLFNDKTQFDFFIHPIVKGIMIHFFVAYIHPFCDGNGRTARALFYWFLLRKKYWLTEYLSISRIISKTKTQYEKSFLYTENDGNDLSYFIQYNLDVMQRAYAALREYIRIKIKEQPQTAEFLRLGNINERQASLLKLFSDKPHTALTIKEVKNRFATSYQTARSDIQKMVEMGLLSSVGVDGKKSTYIRSELFEEKIRGIRGI